MKAVGAGDQSGVVLHRVQAFVKTAQVPAVVAALHAPVGQAIGQAAERVGKEQGKGQVPIGGPHAAAVKRRLKQVHGVVGIGVVPGVSVSCGFPLGAKVVVQVIF